MRSAITVSLVPQAKGGPFVFWDGLATAFAEAAALGFDGIEIFPPSAAGLDLELIRNLQQQHGLAVAAVGTGGGWVGNKWTLTHADPSIRVKARVFIQEIIEAAAKLGAPAILGSMQGRAEGEITREEALG
ncbi:MAG TPA: TIM barrel protein, partial [Chthoniobacteraceae bacterium]